MRALRGHRRRHEHAFPEPCRPSAGDCWWLGLALGNAAASTAAADEPAVFPDIQRILDAGVIRVALLARDAAPMIMTAADGTPDGLRARSGARSGRRSWASRWRSCAPPTPTTASSTWSPARRRTSRSPTCPAGCSVRATSTSRGPTSAERRFSTTAPGSRSSSATTASTDSAGDRGDTRRRRAGGGRHRGECLRDQPRARFSDLAAAPVRQPG
jgi:hypothetical protein